MENFLLILIFCQNFDFAYAFRDISDSNKLRRRIRKIFITIEPLENLLSLNKHITQIKSLSDALKSKNVCLICSLVPPHN